MFLKLNQTYLLFEFSSGLWWNTNINHETALNYYAGPLTHLIYQFVSQGLFHEEMKLAKVISIYKCEVIDKLQTIINLPYFSKVFEKINI